MFLNSAILKKKTGKSLSVNTLANMEQTTYGPRMGMWFTKVNRCGYKELAWESGPEIPFLQTLRAQCLGLPVSSAKGKCTQKPVNNQPGCEHTESGNCVGPKCFSANAWKMLVQQEHGCGQVTLNLSWSGSLIWRGSVASGAIYRPNLKS